ncbi:MAG: hypothetical protein ABMB14_29835, partial [Myxococcota bacterium]
HGPREEGAFYTFTPAELRAILGETDGARVGALLQVTEAGTFERGASVLRLEVPLEQQAIGDRVLLTASLPKLLAARDARPRPPRDDKRIVAWNALMISALARAGTGLAEPAWIEAAVRAYDDLRATAVVDGRWMRTVREGRAHVPAFADDHANLLLAALDLWEATFDGRWLAEIESVAVALLRLFWERRTAG